MRHYIPVEDRIVFPNEHYTCGHGCDNTTFSTLPRTSEKQIELTVCTRCGIGIVFSTVELPRTVGYPRSRRTWGEAVEILSTTRPQEATYIQDLLL